MIKLYFKQAWRLLKQNKLFSSIYIIGTGLAISTVMVLAIIYYVKIAPIYPEVNRDRTLCQETLRVEKTTGSMQMGYVSVKAMNEIFYPLQTPEAVTAVIPAMEGNVTIPVTMEDIPILAIATDSAYWKVFGFSFVEGKPFMGSDVRSGINVAVISDILAKKVFGSDSALGKTITVDFYEYRVCGVVRSPSYITPNSYAEAWIPYTRLFDNRYQLQRGDDPWISWFGSFKVYMLAHSSNDFKAIRKEINERIAKQNAMDTTIVMTTDGYPDEQWQTMFRELSDYTSDWNTGLKKTVAMFLLLLLIPAVNLSGIIYSRMDKRIGEMGVRKAFGARRYSLFNQMIFENLILTCLGGLFGLLLSYLIIVFSQDWIFDIMTEYVEVVHDEAKVSLSLSVLLNPTVFTVTFLSCLVLNLFSAMFPVWRLMRKNIVESLNTK